MRRSTIGSNKRNTISNEVLERAVGKCPVVELMIGGMKVSCLLDTGSQVKTCGKDKYMLSIAGWLKLTAANGLDIPYSHILS